MMFSITRQVEVRFWGHDASPYHIFIAYFWANSDLEKIY